MSRLAYASQRPTNVAQRFATAAGLAFNDPESYTQVVQDAEEGKFRVQCLPCNENDLIAVGSGRGVTKPVAIERAAAHAKGCSAIREVR